MNGCAYGDDTAKHGFKVFKTWFAKGSHFITLGLDVYVNWINTI